MINRVVRKRIYSGLSLLYNRLKDIKCYVSFATRRARSRNAMSSLLMGGFEWGRPFFW